MLDMGVEAFLISSSLEGVLAQRLVRRICSVCRKEWPVPTTVRERLREFGADGLPDRLFHGAGCDECRGIGYRGRVGIFELLPINAELRELVLQRRSSAEVKNAARKSMMTMFEDALQKSMSGLTTVDEVLRVASGDLTE